MKQLADSTFNIQLPANYSKLTIKEKACVREEYRKLQENKCFFCKADLDGKPKEEIELIWVDAELFPEDFFSRPIHLHHDHKTGLTLGAVHAKCNAVLWQHLDQ